MKLKTMVGCVVLFAFGAVSGAFGAYQWVQLQRRSQSMTLLHDAIEATKKCDLEKSKMLAAQAYVLYPDSPLADLALKEHSENRSAMEARCNKSKGPAAN